MTNTNTTNVVTSIINELTEQFNPLAAELESLKAKLAKLDIHGTPDEKKAQRPALRLAISMTNRQVKALGTARRALENSLKVPTKKEQAEEEAAAV